MLAIWRDKHTQTPITTGLSIQEVLELIGFIGAGTAGAVITSYIAYKLVEKGRKVKKHTILQDGNVELVIDEETYKVEFNLFKFIKASWQKKSSIHKNFNQHLTIKGAIGYSNQGDDNINKITKEQKDAILALDENLERPEAGQDPIRTNLTIKVVDFFGGQKWSFMYAGKTLNPPEVEYSEQIKEKLKEIRKDVRYGSKLPVEMIITYKEDDNGEAISGTEKYQILQITGELMQQPEQTSFNFNKKND